MKPCRRLCLWTLVRLAFGRIVAWRERPAGKRGEGGGKFWQNTALPIPGIRFVQACVPVQAAGSSVFWAGRCFDEEQPGS